MPADTMTLPAKLRAAARRPDDWDVPGLLLDAADMLDDAVSVIRDEVVPGWTLDELLSREG